MTLDKLKVAARQHEQREEWRAAIELYRTAIRVGEEASEASDPYLFSRIGDLEQKAGDPRAACEAWEQAVARYGELGLSNYAIAICAKILRLDPARTHTYLEQARYLARKGMLHDATRDMQLYHDQMQQRGAQDTAVAALTSLGEEFPRWEALQVLLDGLLGRERTADAPALAQVSPRSSQGLVFIDTGPLELERASEPEVSGVTDGVEPTVVAGIELERPSDDVLEGLEATAAEAVAASPAVMAIEGLEAPVLEPPTAGVIEGLEVAADLAEPEGTSAVEGLEAADFSTADTIMPLDGLETEEQLANIVADVAAEDQAVSDPAVDIDADEPADAGSELVFLEAEAGSDAESEAATVATPALVVPPPTPPPAPAVDDPLGQRAAGHSLLEIGDRAGGIRAFERALALYQERQDWNAAWQTATELIEAEPQHTGHHQSRVEVASNLGDRNRLVEAYLDLGAALRRQDSQEKAVAVFRRVLELAPEHPVAMSALAAIREGGDPASPAADSFIDLRSMLVDDGPRSTRMRTETTPIRADEDETFREALAEFKRALDENLPIEDAQAHYDLGIAFKEMGLLDEAISSFQKALRAPEARLRTSEALGEAFFEQGRPAVAEAVLRNAERGPEGEAEKIGVLYWLGRALESLQRGAEAQMCYQRVLAVDVLFLDAADRLAQLADGSAV